MQTLRKKTSPCKYRNDPGRFFGDGVQFKAKLIGILEVGEARGDRMCQEALQDLKMAIRAAGEHKQRITIHVTIDGLRLRDEKTGDSLYHHPVHKISFIAQDMTDSRAFGYIFGSPDSGHRFFGIKTDKAASQVVLAMRDLFQVVFELKKKEIELARQQIQSKSIHDHHLSSFSSLKATSGASGSSGLGHNDLNSSSVSGGATVSHGMLGGSTGMGIHSNSSNTAGGMSRLGVNLDSKGAAKEMSPESVADLVDLEQELSSIQRGITQMERITPNDPVQGPPMSAGSGKEEDPFGDSFTNFPTYNLLPPPESGRGRNKISSKQQQDITTTTITNQNTTLSSLLSPAAQDNSPATVAQAECEDDNWLHEIETQNDVFDTSRTGIVGSLNSNLPPLAPLAASETTSTPTQHLSESSAIEDIQAVTSVGNVASATLSSNECSLNSSQIEQIINSTKTAKSDAFTDLDPLGTGRTRPYVDKKYFFQELKNPPKKVLKDLSCGGGGSGATPLTLAATTTTSLELTNNQYKTASAVVDEFLSKEGLFDQTLLSDDIEMHHQQQQQSQMSAQLLNNMINSMSGTIAVDNISGIVSTASTSTNMTISTTTSNSTTTSTATAQTMSLISSNFTTSSTALTTCNTNTTATATTTTTISNNINNNFTGTAILKASNLLISSSLSTPSLTPYHSSTLLPHLSTHIDLSLVNTITTSNMNLSVETNEKLNTTNCPSYKTTKNIVDAFADFLKPHTTPNTISNNNNIGLATTELTHSTADTNNIKDSSNSVNHHREISKSLLNINACSPLSFSSSSSSSAFSDINVKSSLVNFESTASNATAIKSNTANQAIVNSSASTTNTTTATTTASATIFTATTPIITTNTFLKDMSNTNSSNTNNNKSNTNNKLTSIVSPSSSLLSGSFSLSHVSNHQFHQKTINNIPTNLKLTNYALDPASTEVLSSADVVMLPRDTDPFSPTRKKSDPFQDGDVFSKLDPFEFEFAGASANKGESTTSGLISGGGAENTGTQIQSSPNSFGRRQTMGSGASVDVFNGPLQVNLPPESGLTSSSLSSAAGTGVHWRSDISYLERPPSESGVTGSGTDSSIRLRPTSSMTSSSGLGHLQHGHSPASSMLKQQTVDVISSISNKKMPHLFGQARFSKRGDSNSINMRRLQESDSLSETETAPEPPPRPDSALHIEPPPLPPKKQFNDIVIRPRVTSGNAVPPSLPANNTLQSTATAAHRYECLNSLTNKPAADVPPIPLPSRRVGRSDGAYPGPGRPRKPGHTEDNYLAPINCASLSGPSSDVPPLLPPPSHGSSRARAQRLQSLPSKNQDLYENKSEILHHQQQLRQQQENEAIVNNSTSILPDITLSQLLTLGIDELAAKLNVPTSKLSTMTLVELTSYLSEFLEKSKTANTRNAFSPGGLTAHPKTDSSLTLVEDVTKSSADEAAIFKVNFDQQATFVAKFDDTFGEEIETSQRDSDDSFVANFSQFNEPPVAPPILSKAGGAPAVPSADRYAVFREIIDQDLQGHQQNNVNLMEMSDIASTSTPSQHTESIVNATNSAIATGTIDLSDDNQFDAHFDEDDLLNAPVNQPPTQQKIDTKITEVVAQAKDRYAALRDIILVENLFEKKTNEKQEKDSSMQEFPEFSDDFNEDQDLKQIMEDRASSAGTGVDRAGLLDSRGLPAEPSSSALTVEDDDDDEDDDAAAETSLDSNDKETGHTRDAQDQYEKLSTSTQQLDGERSDKMEPTEVSGSALNKSSHGKQNEKFLTVSGVTGLSSSKDDLEIDELMQRAISNLSLDSRERISPSSATNITGPRSTSATLPNPSPVPSINIQQKSTTPLVGVDKIQQRQTQSQKSRPLPKSPQISPIPVQLSAVSNLIHAASKQIGSSTSGIGVNDSLMDIRSSNKAVTKEAWATFDSPKSTYPTETGASTEKRYLRGPKATSKSASLHLPPAPPSNTSQNDTAESPCSSDPRDDGWSKSRRWGKKDRHQTSSSSRDLSPWDDDGPDYLKQKRMIPGMHGHGHGERHGYYSRHPRRMNSCDEDYEYEDDFSNRRDHRKFKQGLSRSRDNFELESPSWYHRPPHHTWSPQDIEQVGASSRTRSFDRNIYERTTYGPPVYDKRSGVPGTSYDRRSGSSYEKRGKYYRDYPPSRSKYDFDEYSESPSLQERYRDAGSFEKLKLGRRSDYENVYDDGRPTMPSGYGSRARAEYGMYERDRKSFDRESVESYESASRRRRSFGSGDVYGSLESREEFRERYMMSLGSGEKSRSLRKSMKLRTTGDIDYEQDSESEFHQRNQRVPSTSVSGNTVAGSAGSVGVSQSAFDSRSLQRPNQLGTVTSSGSGPTRIRKSSGSSPWDGEEPAVSGTKAAWKRPSSAADSERRLAEGRRAMVMGQTPSGSDGEKDRRFRKKQRGRNKDYQSNTMTATSTANVSGNNNRYGNSNYDYINTPVSTAYQAAPGADDIDDDDDDDAEDYVDEDYDEPPTDEDKFERLNRRRHEMHQRMLESERRQRSLSKLPKGSANAALPISTGSKKYHHMHNTLRNSNNAVAYDFDDYEEQTTAATPRHPSSSSSIPHQGSLSGAGSKFSFDGGGFESDFNQNSPPPAPAGTASSCNSTPAATVSCVSGATKSSFRFSNDFSDRERMQTFAQNSTSLSSLQQYDMDGVTPTSTHQTPPVTQKLRFDDNVKVSQFDDAAFEDDFSKAEFDFDKCGDQWNTATADASDLVTATSTSNNTLPTASSSTTATTLMGTGISKKQSLRNSKLQQRQQELIKKSESINIFAKKNEDPFEDDEFFQAPTNINEAKLSLAANDETMDKHSLNKNNINAIHGNIERNTVKNGNNGSNFDWDNDSNFAKFDDNM